MLVDHYAPDQPVLSGGLWDARYDAGSDPNGSSSTSPAQGLSYPLRIDSHDSASGVAEVDVQVDGGQPSVLHGNCTVNGCDQSHSTSYTFQGSQYPPGQHTICGTVKDLLASQQGQSAGNCQAASGSTACQVASGLPSHVTQTCFTVYTKPPFALGQGQDPLQNDQLGLEKFWDYRQIATGAGSQARVNLGTGNLVWNDVPVVDQGQGLSTFVQVTYDSQHRLGDLAPYSSLLPGFLNTTRPDGVELDAVDADEGREQSA